MRHLEYLELMDKYCCCCHVIVLLLLCYRVVVVVAAAAAVIQEHNTIQSRKKHSDLNHISDSLKI